MTGANCTPGLLRFDLLEVTIDDSLKRRVILGLLFRDTLGVDIIQWRRSHGKVGESRMIHCHCRGRFSIEISEAGPEGNT